MPGLTIGDTLPDLQVETTHGKIRLHDYVQDAKFTIIFSHPGDFTPVCTTELGMMAAYAEKFSERGVKLLGFSGDEVESHREWIKDIEAYNGGYKVSFPIGADTEGEVMRQLNMVDPDSAVPSRALHIVGPDKKVKLSFLYPASTGRNMEEVLRVLDSLERAGKQKIATPANWKTGEAVLIAPSVSSEEAKQLFPQGYKAPTLPSNKEYLRFTNLHQ